MSGQQSDVAQPPLFYPVCAIWVNRSLFKLAGFYLLTVISSFLEVQGPPRGVILTQRSLEGRNTYRKRCNPQNHLIAEPSVSKPPISKGAVLKCSHLVANSAKTRNGCFQKYYLHMQVIVKKVNVQVSH